nr:unnamed protein product [Spirometra erinaceieuropaei]
MEKEIKGIKLEMEKLRNLPRFSAKEDERARTYANTASSAVSTEEKENSRNGNQCLELEKRALELEDDVSASLLTENKDPIAVLKDDNGVEIIENSEKAEHLGQYFASVFTRETEFRCLSAGNALETVGPVLDSIHFPAAAMERKLKNLKEAKSSGPDNIPAKFFKELANELSTPLAHIFRSSFELG